MQGNKDTDLTDVKRIWGNLGKSCNEISLFPQSSPLTSCFQLLLWSYVSHCIPALLQLCSDPIPHKTWPAGVLHCLLSAVPLRGHFMKGREKSTLIIISPALWGPFEKKSGGLYFHPLYPSPNLGEATLVLALLCSTFWCHCVRQQWHCQIS